MEKIASQALKIVNELICNMGNFDETAEITMKNGIAVEFTNLENADSILFLPSEHNEILQNIKPETILLPKEHDKIVELADEYYDAVIGITKLPYSPAFCEHILRILKPGGCCHIQSPKEADFEKSLLYGGFMDVSKIEINKLYNQWKAFKSEIEMKSAPLKFGNKLNNNNNNKNDNNVKIWSFGDNLVDDDIELEDENELLDHETEKVMINKKNEKDDCGVGQSTSRKPCKNCTCGRAEQLNDANKQEIKKDFKSSCGSCHLGDSYRCAGCPYLGKPAFDPNDKETVKLLLDD